MRVIKAGIIFLLVIASIDAMSTALPQPMNGLAKGSMLITDSLSPLLNGAGRMITSSSVLIADNSFHHIDSRYKAAIYRLKQQAGALKEYVKANNYNSEYCFLVDMSIPSGKKRFFVYNLNTDVIEASSLVSHGIGSNKKDSEEELQFSNDPSSLRTSLGRYKIGSSYTGNFGLAFKLYGLDKTNSRAYERAIVLHAHSSIPTTETYPIRISESFGCPSVAPVFLETLNNYIKGSKKPILMWIYN